MGIRGLTRYIQENEFLEKYQLRDTNLVIDGNSVSRQLFQIYSSQKNSCFGGDYDKFADYVEVFFQMLADCKVTPFVVFQGGVEHRKIQSKLQKISERLEIVKAFNSTIIEDTSFAVYLPLCLGEVFESIVLKSNIRTVRCDFENYTATLSIAKALNCPILSYDSNYFMCYEVIYIPFQTLCDSKSKPYPFVIRQIKTNMKYLPCQIFKVNNLLQRLRLTSDKLPLLAAMLGNDFISTKDFPKFYLWPDRASFQSRITNLATWLRMKNVETALQDILKLARPEERHLLEVKLKEAMKGYKCYRSKYLINLGLINNPWQSENYIDIETDILVQDIPTVFLENFRKCRYSPHLMDLIIHNIYINFKPQIENMNFPHSHTLSENIICSMQKVLSNTQAEPLKTIVREGECMVSKYVPHCSIDVPSFTEIQEMNIVETRSTILKILGLEDLQDALHAFQNNWQLFTVVVIYIRRHSSLSWPLCCSLVLCKMILQQYDSAGGRIIRFCEKNVHNLSQENCDGTRQILEEMKNFVEYFHMKCDMRMNANLFDRDLVHHMSQFQSCLLHIKTLNDLLNIPFPDILISDCFNGTFIYNFSKTLEMQHDIDAFIKNSLFRKAPKIMASFQSLITNVKQLGNW